GPGLFLLAAGGVRRGRVPGGQTRARPMGVGDGGRVGRLAGVLGGVRVEVGEGRDRVLAGLRAGVAELGLAGGVGGRGGGAGGVLAGGGEHHRGVRAGVRVGVGEGGGHALLGAGRLGRGRGRERERLGGGRGVGDGGRVGRLAGVLGGVPLHVALRIDRVLAGLRAGVAELGLAGGVGGRG